MLRNFFGWKFVENICLKIFEILARGLAHNGARLELWDCVFFSKKQRFCEVHKIKPRKCARRPKNTRDTALETLECLVSETCQARYVAHGQRTPKAYFLPKITLIFAQNLKIGLFRHPLQRSFASHHSLRQVCQRHLKHGVWNLSVYPFERRKAWYPCHPGAYTRKSWKFWNFQNFESQWK